MGKKHENATANRPPEPSGEELEAEELEHDATPGALAITPEVRSLIYSVAAEVGCEHRAVRARLEGKPVRGRIGEKIVEALERRGVAYPRVLIVEEGNAAYLPAGFTAVHFRSKPAPRGTHLATCRSTFPYETPRGDIACRGCGGHVLVRREERADLPPVKRSGKP